ncbi:MAG: 2,5-diamino-6-(ribosylamino)-4(3H)-pyrimidinone 5'-phosphate reductase [Halobacteria archaeon]|nr:2,5-diamino-6-(ribosylamino)-4(3H)-pyrimidinone 5'-phosphate reductase [Halobacteria archaeon]
MHVFINAAMSADGRISNRHRAQIEISDEEDFERVDQLRAESDAIMVGVGTVLADDPSLTVKSQERREKHGNPIRVIADSRARTPGNAEVLRGEGEVIIAVGNQAPEENRKDISDEATLFETPARRVDLGGVLEYLSDRGVEKLMVEGGSELNYSLIRNGLVDTLMVYMGPLIIGGRDSPGLVGGEGFIDDYPELELESADTIGSGIVVEWSFVG